MERPFEKDFNLELFYRTATKHYRSECKHAREEGVGAGLGNGSSSRNNVVKYVSIISTIDIGYEADLEISICRNYNWSREGNCLSA